MFMDKSFNIIYIIYIPYTIDCLFKFLKSAITNIVTDDITFLQNRLVN